MKAIYFNAVDSVEWIETDEPQIRTPDDVKVKIYYTGICGSERLHGKHPSRIPPIISGHEASGIIVELGSAVTNLHIGDRVAIEPQYGCQACSSCQSGMYNICKNKVVLGTTKWQGSFAEYIVAPSRCLVPVPDNISLKQAAVLEPLSVGFHAVDLARNINAKSVAVIGCGPIGISVVYGCMHHGIKNIIATDIADYNLSVVQKMGAKPINARKESVEEVVSRITKGEGVDIVFIAAGVSSALDQAVSLVKRRGLVVIIAHFGDQVSWDAKAFRWKEANMLGTFMYTKNDYFTVLSAMQNGEIDTDSFITNVFPAEECVKVFDSILQGTISSIKILFSFCEET